MGIAKKKTDGNVIIIKAVVDAVVGDVVELDTHAIGVAQTAGLVGEDISVDTRGVYELPADTSEAFDVGELVQWDEASQTCLSTGVGRAGYVVEGKLATVAGTILVKIG